MKLTIEVDGDQAECLAVIHAIFGFFPLGSIVLTNPVPTIPWGTLPVPTPAPEPYIQPAPYIPAQPAPWQPHTGPYTIWGPFGVIGGPPPFQHGDILMPYNTNFKPGEPSPTTTGPAGYLVEVKGLEMSLTSLSQAQVFERMGITWFGTNDLKVGETAGLVGRGFETSGTIQHVPGSFQQAVQGSQDAV
jgi:hypothetical protein